ncbi:MAG: DUF4132 domain-containing protein [Gammaproteobacteria bacterium]|nr:DUF4132 domain-containing protein [Gammaproteobacteria bacterium]
MPTLKERVGKYWAIVEVSAPGKVEVFWLNTSGAERHRKVPPGISAAYPKELRQLNDKVKSIKASLAAHTERVERFYVEDRVLAYPQWREHYVDHPLMKCIASNLIWRFDFCGGAETAILKEGSPVTANGTRLENLPNNTEVRLWHPLIETDVANRRSWGDMLWSLGIEQPFRQVFRETYESAPGSGFEELFRGLHVRQHQFAAVLRSRGWRVPLQGGFESDDVAHIQLPMQWRCELRLEHAKSHYSGHGIALTVNLGELVFFHENERTRHSFVPRVLYSETMRVLDLAVSASAFGYAEDWAELSSSIIADRPALDVLLESRPCPSTVAVRSLLLGRLFRESSIGGNVRVEERYAFFNTASGSYKVSLATGLIFDCADNSLVAVPEDQQKKVNNVNLQGDILAAKIYRTILNKLMKPSQNSPEH